MFRIARTRDPQEPKTRLGRMRLRQYETVRVAGMHLSEQQNWVSVFLRVRPDDLRVLQRLLVDKMHATGNRVVVATESVQSQQTVSKDTATPHKVENNINTPEDDKQDPEAKSESSEEDEEEGVDFENFEGGGRARAVAVQRIQAKVQRQKTDRVSKRQPNERQLFTLATNTLLDEEADYKEQREGGNNNDIVSVFDVDDVDDRQRQVHSGFSKLTRASDTQEAQTRSLTGTGFQYDLFDRARFDFDTMPEPLEASDGKAKKSSSPRRFDAEMRDDNRTNQMHANSFTETRPHGNRSNKQFTHDKAPISADVTSFHMVLGNSDTKVPLRVCPDDTVNIYVPLPNFVPQILVCTVTGAQTLTEGLSRGGVIHRAIVCLSIVSS